MLTVASKTFAVPEIVTGLETCSPIRGLRTRIGGRRSRYERRVIGWSRMIPSPPNTVTGFPLNSRLTPCTVGNCVSVYVSCASRLNIDSDPPPDPNVPDRSTVAMPPSIDRPSSAVPSGMDVPTPAVRSGADGSASRAATAPRQPAVRTVRCAPSRTATLRSRTTPRRRSWWAWGSRSPRRWRTSWASWHCRRLPAHRSSTPSRRTRARPPGRRHDPWSPQPTGWRRSVRSFSSAPSAAGRPGRARGAGLLGVTRLPRSRRGAVRSTRALRRRVRCASPVRGRSLGEHFGSQAVRERRVHLAPRSRAATRSPPGSASQATRSSVSSASSHAWDPGWPRCTSPRWLSTTALRADRPCPRRRAPSANRSPYAGP